MVCEDNKLVLTQEESDFVEELINKNRSLILNTIHANLDNDMTYLFEDCLSEIYLFACQNVSELKKHPAPEGWISVTAKYTTLRMVRSELKRLDKSEYTEFQRIGMEDVSETAIYNIWLEEKTPEKILSTLSKREKQVYEMIYIRGMEQVKVAEKLGLSASTVRNINKSIRNKVMRYINKNCR